MLQLQISCQPKAHGCWPSPPNSPLPAPLHLLQISRMPKANGCRPRTVVFTQGSEPTIVACAGKVRLFPVIKVGVQASGQIYRSIVFPMSHFALPSAS